MKTPRNGSGDRMVRALGQLGYSVIRQRGSHVRLRHPGPPAHTITVPLHDPLKTGTLHAILTEVALMRSITVESIAQLLYGMQAASDNPILAKFRAAIEERYEARLEHVVLFGSQARGDAGADSDYDVAVFLNDSERTFDRWAELDKLAALRVEFLDETGAFFDARPYPATSYQERSPLMHEIRSEGIHL